MKWDFKCQNCGEKTSINYICPNCRENLTEAFCQKCKKNTKAYSYHTFPLKKKLAVAQEKTGIRAQEPFKGVKELINQDRIAEPLEKGLIRQSRGLTVFKDGTVRLDATNSPLTHFKPSWIGTSIEKLRELGYTNDMDGNPLTNSDQTVELLMQDVIIPHDSGKYLVETSKYLDLELEKFYQRTPYYKIKNTDDLVGHLIIGLD